MPVGGALRDDEGRMIGAAGAARFETREELEAPLRTGPSVTGQGIRITPHDDRPPCPRAAPDPSRERP